MLWMDRRATAHVMGDRLVPFGISVNVAAGALVAASFAAALLPTSWPVARMGLLLLVVVAIGWWTSDAAAAAIVAALAFVFLNGFLINRAGQLSWHGLTDAWRLGALAAGAAAGWLLGWASDRIAGHHRFAALEAWANCEQWPGVPS